MAFYSIEGGAEGVQGGTEKGNEHQGLSASGKIHCGKQKARDRWAKQHPELARRKVESQRRAADKESQANVAYDISKQAPGENGSKHGNEGDATSATCPSSRFSRSHRGQDAYEKK